MSRKRKLWSHTVGSRPHRVTVTELKRGGYLYLRVWDAANGRKIERSLGHKDRERAEAYCKKQHAIRLADKDEKRNARTTLGTVVSEYLAIQSPKKVKSVQSSDRRRAEMWLRVLGPNREPKTITTGLWENVVAARGSGAIDANGRPVPKAERRPVGDRTREADCKWLQVVMNWAMSYRTGVDERGELTFLLDADPLRGLEVPHEDAPRRPIASTDRYERIRAVTDDVQMETRWHGKRALQRSWLSEVFDLAMETGQRIRRICELRYDDLDLHRGPNGYLRLRGGEGMKTSKTITVPINAYARAAIDRQLGRRRIVGQAYLFPSPSSPQKPMSRYLAGDWLRRAEKLAGEKPQEGTLWHAYRRGWVNARKLEPDADVAALGGWSSPDTVRNVYQQQDEGRMIEITSKQYELREVKTG